MRVIIKNPYRNLPEGAEVSLKEFEGLFSQPLTDEILSALAHCGVIVLQVPIFFVGIAKIKGEPTGVTYIKDDFSIGNKEEMYRCKYSEYPVPLSTLMKSDYVPLYSREEYEQWVERMFPRKVKTIWLDGEKVDVGSKLFYIRLDDGACGEVKYYDGLEHKYSNTEYLFFTTENARNNAAYRLTYDTFIQDSAFDEAIFTGAEIQEALRKNEMCVESDEYWTLALSVIKYLQGKKAKA